MRFLVHAGGGQPRAGARAALVLLSAIAVGCADYRLTSAATASISDVRVVTKAGEIGDCRPLGRVDSRDTARGCGLTVQPTPEECLKYQVRRSGGDTLLLAGPVGDAYDCSNQSPGSEPAAPRAQTVRADSPEPPAAPPSISTPRASAAAPPARSGVRIVRSREMARGCIYLDDLDLKTACAGEIGEAAEDCVSSRAVEAGGDTVLLDEDRAQIFSCKAAP